MNSKSNKAIVERMMAALARQDHQGFGAGLSDDVRWRYMVQDPRLRAIETKADLVKSWAAGSASTTGGLQMSVSHIHDCGDTVIVEARAQAKFADGRVYDNSFCLAFDMEDGLAIEVREYIDSAHVRDLFG